MNALNSDSGIMRVSSLFYFILFFAVLGIHPWIARLQGMCYMGNPHPFGTVFPFSILGSYPAVPWHSSQLYAWTTSQCQRPNPTCKFCVEHVSTLPVLVVSTFMVMASRQPQVQLTPVHLDKHNRSPLLFLPSHFHLTRGPIPSLF